MIMKLCILVSNKIEIPDAPLSVFDWCNKHLEFANPEYEKNERLGFWTGHLEPRIVLWERKGNTIIIPHGCLEQFRKDFPAATIVFDYKNDYVKINYNSQIQLFDYQQRALNSINLRSGVIVMPCGAGKTQTALAIAASYGLRTLWITHTKELLNQSMNRAQSCFGIDPDQIGSITDGKINVGFAITFATVQTLAKIDLTDYVNYWSMVIVDECHKAVGTPTKLMMFYKVVSQLSAPIKIGLTATPKRSDGLEKCMFALLGPKLFEVSKEDVKQNTIPIKVVIVKDQQSLDDTIIDPGDYTNTDGTLNYAALTNLVVHNEKRNNLIADLIQQINRTGKTCLVLSDRVDHLSILQSKIGVEFSRKISGVSNKHERETALKLLQDRQIGCLFATYPLAKEGLDIPSLDCVVFATPKKDQITVIQSCGRAGRKYPGKEFGVVFDIVDDKFWIFKRYFQSRKSLYKKNGYEVFSNFY